MYTLKDLADIKSRLEALDSEYGVGALGNDSTIDFKSWIVKVDSELWRSELNENYGINVPDFRVPYMQRHYCNINEYMSIAEYGPKCGRDIPFSDDDSQPDDECLLSIQFSSGPYMFGNHSFSAEEADYPREFFKQFISELLSFKPDYKDTTNKSYYWQLENASAIFNAFPEILKRYHDLNAVDRLIRQASRLEALAEKAKAQLKTVTGDL